MTKRGEHIDRPKPWVVRAADRQAGKGWDDLVRQAPESADRAWVAMTSNPRHIDHRQHQLRGSLGTVTVAGQKCEQWQFEATGGGRIWYAIDDAARTLWITQAGTGHPKRTE